MKNLKFDLLKYHLYNFQYTLGLYNNIKLLGRLYLKKYLWTNQINKLNIFEIQTLLIANKHTPWEVHL